MNIFIRSLVSVVVILASVLSPMTPAISQITEQSNNEDLEIPSSSELEDGISSNAQNTLDDEFEILNANNQPSQSPTPTASETLYPTPEPTPTATEEPVQGPSEKAETTAQEIEDNIALSTEKDYLIAGEDVILDIDPKLLPEGAQLVVEASSGLSPKNDYGNRYHAESNTVNLSLQRQSVEWRSNPNAAGPYYFVVKIIKDEEVLSEQFLALDQAVKGHASPQGGSVRWADKGITITVPEGAVDEDVDLIIRQAYAHPIAPYSLSGHSILLTATNAEGKLIDTFNKEVTLEITYDPEEFAGNETTIFISYFDEEKQDWFAVPTIRDPKNHTVYASISHFSEWDLDAGSWEASRLPNLDNFNTQGYSGAVTFNFPIEVPAGSGGFSPNLNLSYNSSVVDGINIYTQADWSGMGWSLEVGGIVRNQHGTSSTEIDDSFSLSLGNSGGLLTKEDTDSANNVVNYFLQNESFTRIQYFKSEDAWIVWDKTGTQYIFGGLLDQNGTLINDENSGAYYPTTCDDGVHAVHPTWFWGLKQIVDKNNQKINISWEIVVRQLNDYCGAGTKAWVALDTKPKTITYANEGYRIQFETTNNRRDYSSAWNINVAYFTQKNIDKITIQKYEGGQWVTAWYYDFIYAQDMVASDPSYSNFIFPLYLWEYWTNPVQWRKTLTLVGIQKCYSVGVCDPAYSFEYGDSMHLTAAENGQGGRVEYTYDSSYEMESSPAFRVGSDRLCGQSGGLGTFGWSGNCTVYSNVWYLLVISSSTLSIPTSLNRPGSFYKFSATASVAGHGDPEDYFRAKILLNGTPTSISPQYYLTNSVWAPRSFIFYLSLNPYQSSRVAHGEIRGSGLEYCPDPPRTCHGTAVFVGIVQPILTKYRVTEKAIIDQMSGDEYTYTYTYDEFASNDAAHSETVETSSYHCGIDSTDTGDDEAICYDRIYNDFRGHGSSTVTDPSGRTTINYYHQDDALGGSDSASMTVVSQFGDNFENGLNTNQWTISLSGGTNDVGDVIRHYGDNALILTEGEVSEWGQVIGSTTTSPDGRSIIVQFMPQAGSEFTIGAQDSTNAAYKWRLTGSDSGISAQYGDGNGLSVPQSLISSGDYEADQWYVAIFTLDQTDGFSVRIWKRVDPAINGLFSMPASTGNFTSEMSWQFVASVSNGTLFIDEYIEAYLYALTLNEYDVITNPNSIVINPPNYYRWAMADFPGFDVHWTPVTATESYLFEGGSAFQATRTEYNYDVAPLEKQYGNVKSILEQEWVNGTGFVNVRQTDIEYHPTDTSTTYIVSLPAQQSVYGCSGATCDNLLAKTQYIYDGNANYTGSPTVGNVTRTRQGIDNNQWVDTLMTYDSWGNQTSVTQYSSYGTDSTFANQGAQTTTTTYDAALHTYPVTVTSAIASHQITMTYDTRLGLPEAMTDPNGLVTLLCYDSRARLIGSVSGDSANPPTCNSQMEISMTYHEATESGGVWTPFWTEATQVLSLDSQGDPDLVIGYRKFYDGIGRQIQTQTVGVDLDGYADGSQTIVNDFFYDLNGLLEYTSMPYNITTPAGFSTQPTCTTSTCVSTIYDALSRVIETQAPDGSVSQTYYGLDATEGLRTVTVADTLQNMTTSYQDVWGQTVRVVPETGPWTEYDYDLAGQLVQVDQVNSTGVFASTYMAYDLGGRKLEMNDPDMGVWTYDYDALGNLTSQTDAKRQETNLCYDDLNRLTGKYYGSSGDCSTPAGWDVTYYYDAYTAGIFSGYTGATTNALGQRTGMLDNSGHTIWSFDQRGNLIEEEKTVGTESFTTEWEYTISGLLESMAYPLVNSTGETIYTTYTPQGGVASVGSLYNTYITLSYDEANRAVNRTYFTSGDGLQTNFDYYDWNEQVNNIPQGGLLESSQTGSLADADSLVSLAYVYDAVGNVASITDLVQSPAQVQNFTYDSLYRLTGATGSAGFGGAYSEGYTYDTQGRMDTKDGATLSYTATRTGGSCQTNSLTPAISSTITHAVSSKSGGNTYTYDCNGNAITRGDQTLIYDEENRLVEVQENSVTVVEYVYDGDGNQVQAVVTDGDLTITTIYIGVYYQQTTTLDESVTPSVETIEWEKYYYAGTVRLAMREDSDNPLYLITDHLASTSLVIDTSGQGVAKRSYLPFGETWGVSATELPTDYTFTGQREAAEIGLKYYVARWYDSEIGHFLQSDTVIPEAGKPLGWNRYAYANYSPLLYNDPTGHFAWIAVGAIIGAAISYGIQVYDNYDSGMSGAEAWTDVNVSQIVGGAIIGASVVALAPVAVAAVGEGLIATGIATGSGALLGAGMATSAVATGMASVLYGPIPGTVERATEAYESVQNLVKPPSLLGDLPLRGNPNDKTSGIFLAEDFKISITSGLDGPAASIPKGTSGFDIVTRTHVEGHASALMHQNNFSNATLYINNPPCVSCNRLLSRMIPGGASLHIIGPNGYNEWFTGINIPK